MSRASLDKQPRDVAAMFDDVAERYDVTNDVLSLGQDRLWRRAVVKAVDAKAGIATAGAMAISAASATATGLRKRIGGELQDQR